MFRINGAGTVTQIATLYPSGAPNTAEGPAVVPPGLGGPHAGEIWIADEIGNAVHTVGQPPGYAVTLNFLSHPSAEGLYVVPDPSVHLLRKLFLWAGGTTAVPTRSGYIRRPTSYRLRGKVILTSESNGDFADTVVVSWDGSQYVKTSFAPRVPGVNEGAFFR